MIWRFLLRAAPRVRRERVDVARRRSFACLVGYGGPPRWWPSAVKSLTADAEPAADSVNAVDPRQAQPGPVLPPPGPGRLRLYLRGLRRPSEPVE